jgi:ketosteroid isomerase-like protein
MASHSTSSVQETADRLAIGELIDAYAHCADRRDAKGQMDLFTDDTRFVVYMDATSDQPTQELRGREALAPVFDDLNTYAATFHFNGQRSVSLDGDRATGESYCLAHHLSVSQDGQRTMMIAAIRYLDAFVKQDGA